MKSTIQAARNSGSEFATPERSNVSSGDSSDRCGGDLIRGRTRLGADASGRVADLEKREAIHRASARATDSAARNTRSTTALIQLFSLSAFSSARFSAPSLID